MALFDILEDAGVSGSIMIFLSVFVIVLLYLIFFQQTLTALIYKFILKLILKNNMHIEFARFSFSLLTGQFSLHRIKIITQDMSISIGRMCGTLYYWRKIPKYIDDDDDDINTRFNVTLNAVEVTMYNRSWSNQLVQETLKLIGEGKTSQEISDYMMTKWPEASPYQLSLLYRAILPFSFKIHSLSVTIGNEELPSYCILNSDYIVGSYSFRARPTPESHIKSIIDCNMSNVSFTVHQHKIKTPPIFDTSMRKIHERAARIYHVLEVDSLRVIVDSDMPGCYLLYADSRELSQVSKEPERSIRVIFGENNKIEYGPYIDKLRRSFMTFFMPFYFNNPIFYPTSKMRIKTLKVIIQMVQGASISIPFVSNILQDEILSVQCGNDTEFLITSPQAPSNPSENKMTVTGTIPDCTIDTSLSLGFPIIKSNFLHIDIGQFYPDVWYKVTQCSVCCHFEEAEVRLHPAHIDFLSQLGTDWGSYYPYQTVADTAANFMPYSYFITIEIQPVKVSLLMNEAPVYNEFKELENFPHADLKFESMVFKLSSPFLECQPRQKQVTFSVELQNGGVEFIYPPNHVHRIRRGEDINNFVTADRLILSGSYGWGTKPTDDIQMAMSIKIDTLGGLIMVTNLFDLIRTIANYSANERKLPEALQPFLKEHPPVPSQAKMHSSIVLSIDFGSVKLPYDLYDTHNAVIVKIASLVMSIDGYKPFWELSLHIDSIVGEIPPTDFPYEAFYKQEIGDDEMSDAVGMLHVDGFDLLMKNISSNEGTYSGSVGINLGSISGFALLPQLISCLELALNATHEFLSDDVKTKRPFSYLQIYALSTTKVSIGSITVFVDMGQLGMLAALLPSGIAVYVDNLIDENFHNSIYLVIPSIDVIHLMQDEDGAPMYPVFRTTLFLNLLRTSKFEGGSKDMLRQVEFLKKCDKENKLLPFIWKSMDDIPESFFENKELFDPAAFTSTLNENFELGQNLATDPVNDNQYTLQVPLLEYAGKDLFATPDMTREWAHHHMVTRHYLHNFTQTVRGTGRIDDIDIQNPSQAEKDRFAHPSLNMSIIIPHELNVEVMPVSIPIFAAAIMMMNLRPNSQLLSNIVRSNISEYFEDCIYMVKAMGVMIPSIHASFIEERNQIDAYVNELKFRTEIDNSKNTKSMALSVKDVEVAASVVEGESKIIQVQISNIKVVKLLDKMGVKLDPIILTMQKNAPQMIRELMQSLSTELVGIPLPKSGKRLEDFTTLIKSSPDYLREIRRIRNTQMTINDPLLPDESNAKISAMYTTLRLLGIPSFLENFRCVNGNEETDVQNTSMFIEIPPIIASYINPEGKSSIEIKPYPVTLDSSPTVTAVSCGIESININATPSLITFVQNLSRGAEDYIDNGFEYEEEEEEPENEEEEERTKPIPLKRRVSSMTRSRLLSDMGIFNALEEEDSHSKAPSRKQSAQNDDYNGAEKRILAHVVVNDVNIKFAELNVSLNHLSAAFQTNPSNEALRKFSITASFNSFSVSLAKYLDIAIGGLKIVQRAETLEGILNVLPITVSFPIEFALNPGKCIDDALKLSSVHSLQENQVIEKVMSKNLSRSASMMIDPTNKEEEEEEEKVRSKKHSFIQDVLDALSLTLMIEPITVSVQLDSTDINLQIPGISGLASSQDHILRFFTFIHEPVFSFGGISAPIANFLLHGAYHIRENHAAIFLMLGQITASLTQDILAKLLGMLNSVLSKLGERPKKSEKFDVVNTILDKEPKKKRKSTFALNFQFLMPQITFGISDIDLAVDLYALFFNLELGDELSWDAQINPIVLSLSEATAEVEVYASFNNKIMRFMINDPRISLTKHFFQSIPNLLDFFERTTSGIKNQEHVNALISDINDTVAQSVEKGAEMIIKNISKKEDHELAFPTELDSEFIVEIHNLETSINLIKGGEFGVNIPNISLFVQRRKSSEHKEMATGIMFKIEGVQVVLDSSESTTTTGPSSDAFEMSGRGTEDMTTLSHLTLGLVSLSLINFQKKFTLDSEIDNFKVELFPSFLLSILRLKEVFTPDCNPKEEEEEETKEDNKKESENEKKKERQNILEDPTFEIEANFRCSNTEIVLNPIANSLPLPRIEVNALLQKNHVYLMLSIPMQVQAKLSPQIITWIRQLRRSVYLLQINNSRPIAHKQENKLEPKAKSSAKNVFDKVTQLPDKVKGKTKIEFDVIVSMKEVELNFSCKPRRSDISAIVGFGGLNAILSSQTNALNASIKNISMRTHNIYALQNAYSRASKLFEFKIPDVDVSMMRGDISAAVDKAEFSISSDKIEELTLFNEVWLQPFIRSMGSLREEGDPAVVAPKAPPVKEAPLRITFVMNSLNLFFNYTAGAGNMLLKLAPIRAELSPEAMLLSINTVSVNSFGQLAADINIDGIFVMKDISSSSQSAIVGMISRIVVLMKSLEDPFVDLSVGRINLISKATKKESNVSSILLLSVDTPVVRVTAQTVPNVLSFYHTITDPILAGIVRAGSSAPKINTEKKSKNTIELISPNSKLSLLTSNFKAELFRYYFKDNEAIRLTAASANIFLNISKKELRTMRDLKFGFKQILLSKLSIEEAKDVGSRDILKLPPFGGDLDTIQDAPGDTQIHYDFVTDFDGMIEATLNLTDYEYLVALLKYAVKQMNLEDGALKAPEEAPKKEPKVQYTFIPNKYKFDPGFKVGMGASIKPNIGWLLTQFSIADEHIIPASLFEAVCLGLEKLSVAVASAVAPK